MSSDIEFLPAPNDPTAFESLCLDLWREIWGPESGAQKYGRSGQGQHGVDVFGRIGEKWVGVQCKQKSGSTRSTLTSNELKEEVRKARDFGRPLELFVIATTGDRDAKIQTRAQEITDAHAKEGRFRVEVWAWPDIWHELYRRPKLLATIGPIYWPQLFGPWSAKHLPKVAPSRLTHVTEVLFGREAELAKLDAAWADPNVRVVTFVAWGGVGKTSLVAKWAAGLDLGGADYFDWSFYSQGTREEGSASGEPFLNAALRFFGDEEGEKIAASTTSAWDKGAKLASFVARRKALLILDGLEPLQYPPSSPIAGQLKDPGVTALLRGLAQGNPGLCVVTTREGVKDLSAFHESSAPEWSLERLGTAAGVALLDNLEVKGSRQEKEKLVDEMDGHALTLSILGSYLRDALDGDIRRLDLVELDEADREERNGHAFRAIATYEKWLGEEKEAGARQIALLRLLGLFDRPADLGCLKALRAEPAIPGLTEPIVGLSDIPWNLAVKRLSDRGLLSKEGDQLDAHPLVREYFAQQLRKKSPEAWSAAHGRLFEHLRDSTPRQPGTLEGLQPLYQAVAHGCHAGRYEEARAGIYLDRISRGAEAFVVRKLGAFGADLGAVVCFFDPPWRRVSSDLSEAAQAWLLNQAAFHLRALGRLTEALEPMRAGLEMGVKQENWSEAARRASNLSELELTLGDVAAAVRDAEQSVTFADRSGDALQKLSKRTAHADALHQAGRRAEALSLFREAERRQGERQPKYPQLDSLRGFRYCDLLLGEAERAAGRGAVAEADGAAVLSKSREALREVEERAAQTLEWASRQRFLLDIALDHLTLGRAALYRSILFGSDRAPARAEIEQAVDGLRRAGDIEFVAKGLLTRAWLYLVDGDPTAACADLAEAQEIAERGPMPLYLADIALHRARLFGDREALAVAQRLIEKHGYGRRLGELADAEAATQPAVPALPLGARASGPHNL